MKEAPSCTQISSSRIRKGYSSEMEENENVFTSAILAYVSRTAGNGAFTKSCVLMVTTFCVPFLSKRTVNLIYELMRLWYSCSFGGYKCPGVSRGSTQSKVLSYIQINCNGQHGTTGKY